MNDLTEIINWRRLNHRITLSGQPTYIPVDFDNPTDADYLEFCDAMNRVENDRVHVHCIYNARVPAFFFRYAKSEQEFSETETFTLMDSVWRPGGVWAKFIGNDNATDQPNRYSGYDY